MKIHARVGMHPVTESPTRRRPLCLVHAFYYETAYMQHQRRIVMPRSCVWIRGGRELGRARFTRWASSGLGLWFPFNLCPQAPFPRGQRHRWRSTAAPPKSTWCFRSSPAIASQIALDVDFHGCSCTPHVRAHTVTIFPRRSPPRVPEKPKVFI